MVEWRGTSVCDGAARAVATVLCGLALAAGHGGGAESGAGGGAGGGADGARGRAAAASAAFAAPVAYAGPAVETEVVALVNEHRTEAGCPAVRTDPDLREAAEEQSGHMDRTGELTHVGAGGTQPLARAEAAGYDTERLAENLAHGPSGAAAVVDAWLDSPAHRANLLDCAYRDMGVALTGAPADPWWAQVLGTERD
ncbi:CAP domain-containing protein [Streptomyces armeniacus]|uniref:CAP domain-containing protein n=1 Tax=Streptomyces armeniacus TaxID=83291 RepID=UPI001AD80779|nr:CAP domain-containing protein [Streptomyces armeniacus]